MLNELDRELGRLHVPNKPWPAVAQHFHGFPIAASAPERYVQACEAEETYLVSQLENLNMEPDLRRSTRDAIDNLLQETRANLNDILFLRENHPALRA